MKQEDDGILLGRQTADGPQCNESVASDDRAAAIPWSSSSANLKLLSLAGSGRGKRAAV